MTRKSLFSVLNVLTCLGLVLAACAQPTATPVPPTATEKAAATAVPTVVPDATTAVPEATPAAPTVLWSKELKQAIAAAIDREAIVDRVFEGRNTPAYSMVPPSYPGATEPFLDKYGTRNLEMAKQILTDLGYTADKPFTFELWYPPDHYGTTTADVMQVVKEQLEETGLIKVTLQTQAWAQYIGESVPEGKFPANILGWFPDFADPETWLTPFASCNQSPDQGANYCNPAMDALLEEGRTTTDPAARAAVYKQLGELYAEEVPTLPLFWEPEYISYRKGVEAIAIAATFQFNYAGINFAAEAKPAAGNTDTLIIGTTDTIDSLDPADAYATADWEILNNISLPLLTYPAGETDLVPGAAEAMPAISADGKTYTFTLRKDVKYADGTVLKASDFVYAWERMSTLNGQVATLLTNYIEGVEAPDDLTVVYHLKGSYAFFPALAATAPFVPVHPALFPKDQLVQFPETLNGIGPYQMTSFKEGEQMVLEANPNYFGDPPKIKTVIIKYFAKPNTMSQAVEKGEIDVAWRILGAVEAVRLQKEVPDVTVVKIDAPTLRYLVFNMIYVPGQ